MVGLLLPPEGGVLDPAELPSVGVVDPGLELGPELPSFLPVNCSSLLVKVAFPLNKLPRSSLTIVFVGMLGVSFSKPPCMYMNCSRAQTVCLNLWIVENFFHSELSVS
jgi:hypothetical protein